MTKKELEKKLEKGESVWCIDYINHKLIVNSHSCKEIANISSGIYDIEEREDYFNRVSKVCFNTKAEAEHYLHHANITRTVKLPFLTWEEFKDMKILEFNKPNNELMILRYDFWLHGIILEDSHFNKICWSDDEENFYKAYDECVRLFKGRSEINEVEK